LVDDGVHGLLVPPGDAAALAGGICRLMESPPWAERLGAAARQRALERHDPRRRAGQYERLYGRLLERPLAAEQALPEFLGKQAAQAT
jgi:glycosyltransferase involved in cell wall biosynthesis